MKASTSILLLLALYSLALQSVFSKTEVPTQVKDISEVRYTYLSQRWLTKSEREQFEDIFGLVLAVRMRLSNEGKTPVYYLADGNGSIRPQGYELFRKRGGPKWEYLPPSRGREGPPGSEFGGSGYVYLELPPGAAIEFELYDWTHQSQEHAFSTFIKLDRTGRAVEIISDVFRPLSKN